MKILSIFLLFCVGAAAGKPKNQRVCRSEHEDKLYPFNEKPDHVAYPCKYWALRNQKCGNFIINLIPGNTLVGKTYRLETLWLNLRDATALNPKNNFWDGRTSNKIAVRYYNKEEESPFRAVDAGGTLQNLQFKEGKDKDGAFIQTKDFKIHFLPWSPSSKKYKFSAFRFECFSNEDELKGYPFQLCGGNATEDQWAKRAEEFGVPYKDKSMVVYYDLLTNEKLVQGNERCEDASRIFEGCTTPEQKMLVLKNCHPILSNTDHVECAALYGCDPMDTFNACLSWGCTGKGFQQSKKQLCAQVAKVVQFCPEVANTGNLTDRIAEVGCFEDFPLLE